MTLTTKNDVDIKLKTTITQDNESETFTFDTVGELIVKNQTIFLRYTELIDGQNPTNVLFKIEKEHVRLNRSGDSLTKLAFAHEKRLPAHYETTIGQMNLETHTTAMRVNMAPTAYSGTVDIDYELYANDIIAGEYRIRLQFNQISSKLN
ncbi:DUF1934 domain-containing protein [Leuconostoc carnosum]|uniref:DUF1934 domain-containing protein n=2 Tax=Leuconostoc carnosum TaxID=1252 RepID=K0DDI8_LEUCJ|nr:MULTISPECIES: DUF1934 domain-containing protein [Leuconostoc]AFT82071.1 hypothetical protein C270_05810 [Leuconostoc carnosum JB16]KAA8325609.1 DUF1934 domain-containing protein [Leuconostoc carnosum]KAA8328638.1 DUF1934 domain-containing protein [Leuconostoc carnosum]KAA8359831.1 DUF1934 domain-containing protein [Leuconostoc carnosum]KAA8365406.1 DUF1934 domain-containing protein [Leuconostoc carnosum]